MTLVERPRARAAGIEAVTTAGPGAGLLLTSREPAPESRRTLLLLAGLLAIGTAVRLTHLGDGLWFDEIQTLVDYVRRPAGEIVTTFDSQNNHLFYSLLAHASIALFGESAWALRLPAALLGVASLWATHRFGRAVSSSREALLATALLALSYHHVWFSQNARGYTGLLLFTLLASHAFVRLLERPGDGRGRLVAVYGASIALAAYTHITAAFVAAAHALVWAGLAWANRRTASREALGAPLLALLCAGALAFLLYAPVLGQFVGTLLTPTMGGVDTAWKSPVWFAAEALKGLSRGVPGGWLALAAGAVVAGAGLASFWRRSPAVLALMVLPGLVSAAAIFALSHNLWPRFFFFSAGFAVLIVIRGGFALARAAAGERGERLATLVTAAVVLASAVTVPRAWGPKQDYEGAARYVDEHRSADEAVLVVDMTEFPYRRYLGRDWTSVQSPGELAAAERANRRTWLLYTFPIRLAAVHPDLWARLQSGYRTVAVFPGTLGGGAIFVATAP